MPRTAAKGDVVLRVSEDLKVRVPGVVVALTGVDSAAVAAATGASIYLHDPRSNWIDRVVEGSTQNVDGTTAATWNFAALSGLKLATTTTIAAATSGEMNLPAGKFILSSGAAAYTLTNNLITATSIVLARVETAGDTVNMLSVVPGAGSAVFTLSGNVGADTTISFTVFNGN